MDRRHLRRQKIVQQLFAYSYSDASASSKDRKLQLNVEDPDKRTLEIIDLFDTIDPLIEKYAQKYDISKIARVDAAILRLGIFELMFDKKVPPKVIINEAVELAKELGGENSPSFVNAVLGKVYDEYENSEASHKEHSK